MQWINFLILLNIFTVWNCLFDLPIKSTKKSTDDKSVNVSTLRNVIEQDTICDPLYLHPLHGLCESVHRSMERSQEPLFINDDTADDGKFVYRSILTKYLPGYPAGRTVTGDNRYTIGGWNYIRRVFSFNETPISLFHAVIRSPLTNVNRMVVNVRDSSRYFYPTNADAATIDRWFKAHAITYELTLPKYIHRDQIFAYMLEDLNKVMDLKGRIEEHDVNCWVIVRTDPKNPRLRSSGGPSRYIATEGVLNELRHVPLSEVIDFLGRFRNIEPIVDETGFADSVDWKLDITYASQNGLFEVLDMNHVREILKGYGLHITMQRRSAPILYLTDKPEIYSQWK